MRTHIELDDRLLTQIQRLGRFTTKKAAVNTALAEYAKLLNAANSWNCGAKSIGKGTSTSCARWYSRHEIWSSSNIK